jgi:hypothetical protein
LTQRRRNAAADKINAGKRSTNMSLCHRNQPAQPAIIADAGKVRLGGYAPTLAPSAVDAGKVRLGGYAPTLAPAAVDAGKVRLGGYAPALPSAPGK